MGIDIRKIKKLIELVKATGINELEVQEDKERVRITYGYTPITVAPPLPTAASSQPEGHKNEEIAAQSPPICDMSSYHVIKSPMVGTVYLAASPDAKSFVEIGQRVQAGDVLCLIEAMKMFNRIESDKDGVLKTILVGNEQPVEYGHALFVIE